MSPVTQYINILAITITCFKKNGRSLGSVFPFILKGTLSSLPLLLLQHILVSESPVNPPLNLGLGLGVRDTELLLYTYHMPVCKI